jgi:hypothetical protein
LSGIYSSFRVEEHEKLFQIQENHTFFVGGMNLAHSLFAKRFRRLNMKNVILALTLLVGLSQSGCAFLGGAAVGTLATGAVMN